MAGENMIHCKWCGDPSDANFVDDECYRCWELRTRCQRDPVLAFAMLADPPVPELKGSCPLVLYFDTKEGRDEFERTVIAVAPNMVSRFVHADRSG